MSRNKNVRRRAIGRPLAVCVFALALLAAAITGVVVSGGSSVGSARAPVLGSVDRELAPAEQQMLAQSQRFSPGDDTNEAGDGGDGASDWAMHAVPGSDISLASINASREAWRTLRGRPNLDGNGHWQNLGPDNAVYALNPFRNRSVYVPNAYVAGGRTPFSVIDPNCVPGNCRYWLANAG